MNKSVTYIAENTVLLLTFPAIVEIQWIDWKAKEWALRIENKKTVHC